MLSSTVRSINFANETLLRAPESEKSDMLCSDVKSVPDGMQLDLRGVVMEIEEAKSVIYDSTADGAYVERCIRNKFVRMSSEEQTDPIFIHALEALHKGGELVQVASAGQSRSTVAYRRSDRPADVQQLK